MEIAVLNIAGGNSIVFTKFCSSCKHLNYSKCVKQNMFIKAKTLK